MVQRLKAEELHLRRWRAIWINYDEVVEIELEQLIENDRGLEWEAENEYQL